MKMLKELIVGLAVSLGIGAAGLLLIGAPSARFSNPYAEPRAAVVQIFYGEEDHSGCSGVMIAPMRLMTAAHCVKAPFTVGVERMPGKVLRKDEGLDVALVAVAAQCPCTPLAASPAELDEPVLAIGYPMNNYVFVQMATEGRAQGEAFHKSLNGPRLRLSVPIAPGNSGGGIFVRRGGEWQLAGILTTGTMWSDGGFSRALVPHLSAAAGLDSMRAILAAPAPEGVSAGLDL